MAIFIQNRRGWIIRRNFGVQALNQLTQAFATGTGTASAIGQPESAALAGGVGAAPGVGFAILGNVGLAKGTATAVAIGVQPSGVGGGTGSVPDFTTTIIGVGASVAAIAATAAGTATATAGSPLGPQAPAIGAALWSEVGLAQNTPPDSPPTVVGVGASVFGGVGEADGLGAASGSGAAGGATQSAPAQAIGAALWSEPSLASGIGAALAISTEVYASVGTANGVGAANGLGGGFAGAVASGIGAALGIGAAFGSETGLATGAGTASAVGIDFFVATGTATGTGTAHGLSAPFTVAFANGLGAAPGIGAALDSATGLATGIGAAPGVSTQTAGFTHKVGWFDEWGTGRPRYTWEQIEALQRGRGDYRRDIETALVDYEAAWPATAKKRFDELYLKMWARARASRGPLRDLMHLIAKYKDQDIDFEPLVEILQMAELAETARDINKLIQRAERVLPVVLELAG